VRASARQLEGVANLSTRDTRYQAIKNKAIAMLPDMLKGMPEWEQRQFMAALTPPTSVVNLLRSA